MRVVQPFGQEVEDYRAGVIATTTINMNRDPETTAPVQPLAVYPWHQPPAPPPDTPEEAAEKLRALLNAKANPDGTTSFE
jgi:hypothetical protein